MDTFRALRLLLYFALGLVLGGFAVVASADTYSAQQGYLMSCAVPGPYGTAEAGGTACGEYEVSSSGWHSGFLFRCDPHPYNKCYYRIYRTQADATAQNPITATYNYTYGYSCPYGGTLTQVGGTWQCQNVPSCPTGQTRDENGQCINTCATGAPMGGEDTMMQTDPGASVSGAVCINGCGFTYSASSCVGTGGAKTCGVFGPFVPTGDSCAPATPAAGNPPVPCKFPKAPGTVNGIQVCVDAGSTSQKQTTTATKTDPNGNPSTTTQQQVTTCDGDKCTTVTTTTNTGGGVGGGVIGGSGSVDPAGGDDGTTTTQVEQPKSEFCESNPNAATCQKAGTFGGDCTTGFVCQGDAVECAAAKASWQTACAMGPADGTSLGEKIAAGNDPDAANMPWHPSQKQTNDVSGLLNQSNPYNAACIPDIHFSIAGRSGTIPTSEWCSMLIWIGNLMLAGALMGAAAIIFRRS